jgi:SH3-like domain-containing protein
MRKILFHIILLAFFLMPKTVFGDDGKCIEGDCVNGKGIYFFSNDEKFDGEFKNGEINGDGIYTYLDGSKYVGEFANGVRHGQGFLKSVKGITYVGWWADDLPNGQGLKTQVDGMQYFGEFKSGVMYGSGRIVMPDGNKLKIKWGNAPTLKKEGNQSELEGNSDKNIKDWYMTATLGKTQNLLSQEPQQIAKHLEISSQDLITGESSPYPQLDESVVTTEQIAPQSSRMDQDPVKDKDQTEAISISNLAENEKIESGAATAAVKRDETESEVTFPLNSEATKAVDYFSIAVGANIRSDASLTSAVLRSVPSGYPVVVLERKTDWFLVKDYMGRKGWVYASLVTAQETVIIKVFKGNLRSGPNLKEDIIIQLDHGTIMSVLERNGEWLKVSNFKELTGWLNQKIIWPVAEIDE